MIIVGQSETRVTRHTASLVSSGMLFQSRETLMTKAQPSVDCLIYILFYFNLFYFIDFGTGTYGALRWSKQHLFIYLFLPLHRARQAVCIFFMRSTWDRERDTVPSESVLMQSYKH